MANRILHHSDHLLEHLLFDWGVSGAMVNGKVSKGAMNRLEQKMGKFLPSEFIKYLNHCDGMLDYECDDHLVSFWSVERIIQNFEQCPKPKEGFICFADRMLFDHFFLLEVSSERKMTSRVIVQCNAKGIEFDTFFDFVDSYLSNWESVLNF